jgi:hypothetical protein
MCSKAWVSSRLIAGIAKSAEGMNVGVLSLSCVMLVVATATS